MDRLELMPTVAGTLQCAWPDFAPGAASWNLYVNGVFNQNVTQRLATVVGLQGASYDGVTKTPPGTYTIKVVAVVGGLEKSEIERVVTMTPTSVMLVTPMKRPFPFGNTGLN